MNITQPLALLGGLSPKQFMRRHWQKKPLLVRQAIPDFKALLDRAALFALAADDDVESRLVMHGPKGWQMRSGPFTRRALPPLKQSDWTLLVQGVDLHVDAVHDLLQQFRFVPEARLDDLMISYATDGGGVGPHFDSYDVFLLQAQGRRRWRIARQSDLTVQQGVPLKILSRFVPEQEFVLEPGDMLYLPPRYAHEGVALGECMTYSIGFRAPNRGELGRELLQRLADDAGDAAGSAPYRDAAQPAVDSPGRIPARLQEFAQHAVQAALKDSRAPCRVLGEYLTEPKAHVWFDAGRAPRRLGRVVLDRRTRMMFDADSIFINGESYPAGARDAAVLRQLADRRCLGADDLERASPDVLSLLACWYEAGWLHEGAPRAL
jgi:50S ribosomal protein L16 3-hydroxylase